MTDPLADLRARLRATRWPEPGEGGVDVDELRELCAYWADGFDWPAQQARLDALPRRRVTVDGVGIHVIHAASGRFPLLLTHGWPDSGWRYWSAIPLLTDLFDVVVPDVPGFGFSDHEVRDAREVAALWAGLMTELGYERFGAAGGDIGSHVSRYLALDFPERVVAVHRTDGGLPAGPPPADLTPEEREWLDDAARWAATEGAYAAMHSTKPLTAAVGLTDSPAGLAAWILEKMQAWSDSPLTLTRDDVLTNITVYWLTGTIGTSMRMYRANAAIPLAQRARRVEVPSGFSIFAGDVVRPPRAWLERTTNLVSFTEPPRGGHFAAAEEPELYAAELRAFFGPYA